MGIAEPIFKEITESIEKVTTIVCPNACVPERSKALKVTFRAAYLSLDLDQTGTLDDIVTLFKTRKPRQ